MKRWTALILSLVWMLSILPAAAAAEAAPPAWVKDGEYTVFEGDGAYAGDTWQAILQLRTDAEAGNPMPQEGDALYEAWEAGERTAATAAQRFELGLVGLRYTENSGRRSDAFRARRYFSLARDRYMDQGGTRYDATYNLLDLWYLRSRLVECSPESGQTFSGLRLQEFLTRSGYTMAQFRDCSALELVTDADWAAIQKNLPAEQAAADAAAARARVTLDGNWIDTENLARVVNGRTMIPVRCLAEQMGAEVSYDKERKAARIVRAGVEILMPIGSKTCTVNGKPFTMDAAPYIENGRTMIPARYVSELFGQSIQWVSGTRTAAVTENKTLAGDTNLEPWAMAMGAYLNAVNNGGRPTVFGGRGRGLSYGMDTIGKPSAVGTVYTYQWARYLLENSWNIHSRKELLAAVPALTDAGHNADFLRQAEQLAAMPAAEYRQLLKTAGDTEACLLPYTKHLGEKWGDRGILCWDLFRVSNLVQWGYAAGYLTYPEALALLEPAAALVQTHFKSWNEAFENYLDGYNWWAREHVGTQDPWTVTRGPYVKKLMQNYRTLFDDSLFKTPVKGVPSLSGETLTASVS